MHSSATPSSVPSLTGTCAFRLMPNDDLVSGPSTASVTPLGPEGLTLTYTWTHPDDGDQCGSVLVGGRTEDGQVEAVLFDTWHQQPGFMRLTGTRADDRIELFGSYAEEWGWTINIRLGADVSSMVMQNVVPASAVADHDAESSSFSPGPYDVMVAEWRPRVRATL